MCGPTVSISQQTQQNRSASMAAQRDRATTRSPARLLSALCLAAVLAIGSAAVASPAAAAPSVTVRTRDLDLSSTVGAQTLLRRLDRAADAVCEGSFVRQYRAARRRYLACHQRAMADALAHLDAPLVRAQYVLRIDDRSRVRGAKQRTEATPGAPGISRQ
jgi:UrcA family protein